MGGASGTVLEEVEVTSIQWGYAFPRRCSLLFPGVHDVGVLSLTNNNEIWVSDDNFATLIFRGRLEVNSPRGVLTEGIEYDVLGLEHLANRFITKFNCSVRYEYNVDSLPDFHGPNSLGARWTVGQIMIDILEHAIGLPNSGAGPSDIPLHHPSTGSITETYMPDSVLLSYTATDILALDLELGEFRVTTQRFWDLLRSLVEKEDSSGIFIDPTDPTNPTLVVHDFTASTTVDFKFGQIGVHLEDRETTPGDPLVTNSRLDFNLTPVKTKIIIEGRGQIAELIPLTQGGSIDGTMVPHWDDSGGTPGTEYIIHDPQNLTPFWEGTLSNGLVGPLLVLDGIVCHEDFASWDIQQGIVHTNQDLRTFTTIEVWTLYLKKFQVIAGPGGDAFTNYGMIAEEAIYDEKLLHPSHPICNKYILVNTYQYGGPGNCADPPDQESASELYCQPQAPRDDTTMMQAIADALLARLGDEKIDVTLTVDVIDLDLYSLLKAGNLLGLNKWSTLNAQIMTIEIKPQEDTMVCQLTNDVFRVPSYAEWKRRFMLRSDLNVINRLVERLRHPALVGGDSNFSRGDQTNPALPPP